MAQQYYYSQQQQARKRGPGAHHAITGAANNGSGLIRITAPMHSFSTGNVVDISGVLGTTEANKTGWTITVIDVNTFDLVGSTFSNAYVSGGVVSLQ
jgi:Ubiquitin-activating enzyme E1 FCCH domain